MLARLASPEIGTAAAAAAAATNGRSRSLGRRRRRRLRRESATGGREAGGRVEGKDDDRGNEAVKTDERKEPDSREGREGDRFNALSVFPPLVRPRPPPCVRWLGSVSGRARPHAHEIHWCGKEGLAWIADNLALAGRPSERGYKGPLRNAHIRAATECRGVVASQSQVAYAHYSLAAPVAKCDIED